MISVLMCIYNERLDWIKQAFNSIMEQSYQNFEFIIVIDNPKISTEVLNFIGCSKDARITVIQNETNIGLAKSLNKAIKVSKGEYLARMDADDISERDRFEKELHFLEQNDADLVSTNKILIDEEGRYIGKDAKITRDPCKTLEYGNFINHSSVLMKTSAVKNCGGYRILSNSEDYDLWLRMIDAGYRLTILDEYLLRYRIRSNSASLERQLEQYYATRYLLKCKKERACYGTDNFSEKSFYDYIKSQNMCENKKKKFAYSVRNLERAIEALNNKHMINAGLFVTKAIFYQPSYVISRLFAQIKIRK